jgi:DNA-binding transcriptional ArsR family regulator
MHDDKTVAVLKALADPTRLKLVRELANTPALQDSCGNLSKDACLSQPAMSHHFAKLAAAGVIIEQKEGKEKSYKLNRQLLTACGIVAEQL